MAAPPSVTQALAGCFLLLLLVQLVVHESTLAAHVSSGPELLSRRTFGVGRVLPLEHSIAAFLRMLLVYGFAAGKAGAARKELWVSEPAQLVRQLSLSPRQPLWCVSASPR